MNSAKSTVPFKGTPEQEKELLKVIEEKKGDKGALMPILQKAQEIYGYLPIEVQAIISDNTGIPLEKDLRSRYLLRSVLTLSQG